MSRRIELNYKKKTKRLTLRLLQKSDFKLWQQFLCDMSAKRNQWDWSPAVKEKLTKSVFAKSLKCFRKNENNGTEYIFFVVENKTQKMIGLTVLRHFVISDIQNSCEMGFHITNRHWGKGYGFEATKGTLSIAFDKLQLRRVEAAVAPYNKRSIGLIKKIGMKRIGKSKNHFVFDGKAKDLILFSLTKN